MRGLFNNRVKPLPLNIRVHKARTRMTFYMQVKCKACKAKKGFPCVAISGFVYPGVFHMDRMRRAWRKFGNPAFNHFS